MKFLQKTFPTLVVIVLLATAIARGQSSSPTGETTAAPDTRPANVLFAEVDTYVDKKFSEFNKQKIPYDSKLDTKTKQEQKDLAAKYAEVLHARSSLSEADQFYLGMLYHLAGNAGGALEAMHHY